MNWLKWVIVVYALINIAMGIQAYFFPFHQAETRHMMSLAGGAGSGVALLFSVYITTLNEKGGYIMASFVTAFLLWTFGWRILTKPSIYPGAISIAMALAVLGLLTYAHFAAQAAAKKAQAAGS